MLSWWKSRGEDPLSPSPPVKFSPSKHVRSSRGPAIVEESVTSPDKKPSPSSLSISKSRDTIKNDKDRSPLQLDTISPLSFKDLIVFVVEIAMVYSCHITRLRNANAHDYHSLRGKTRKEIERDLLFMQGWAAPGSLLVGYLADGYIGTYYLARTSIFIVFIMATCLLFEQILIFRMKINPYADAITWVAAIAHFLNHSTGFSRVVFGLENMRNKKPSAVSLYLFIFTFIGDYPSSGGLLMLVATVARLDSYNLVQLSCYGSAFSVVLFITTFKSMPIENTSRSASRKAVKCFLDGLRHMCTNWCRNESRGNVYMGYDKPTVDRAKGLANFTILLCPIVGFIFIVVGRYENLYKAFHQSITLTGLFYYTGVTAGSIMIMLLAMVITYFLIIPGLTYLGYPRQFNYHFSLGYFFAIMAMYFVAVVLKLNEVYVWDSEIGYVRIFNARDREVVVNSPVDSPFNSNITVPPHSNATGTFVVTNGDARLVLTTVSFDDITNVTFFMRVEAKKCFGYAVVDPPEVIEITKELPLFEGPPMTNDYSKPRIYLFNAARALEETTVRFRDLSTGRRILNLLSPLGSTLIFQIPPGDYEIWVEHTDHHLTHHFNDGGLYGILLLADITTSFLELDIVAEKKELGSATITCFSIFYGLSLTFSYVALRTMTYMKAPNGLLCTTFGCLSFQENLVVWVLVLGYHTWHQQIYGDELLTYCLVLTVLFCMSVFIMLKYNKFYS